MARFTGGPVIVFISGRLATIRGLVGSRMSMIDTVSLPGGWVTVLPVSSKEIFSSLPVIRSCAPAPPAGASRAPAATLSANSHAQRQQPHERPHSFLPLRLPPTHPAADAEAWAVGAGHGRRAERRPEAGPGRDRGNGGTALGIGRPRPNAAIGNRREGRLADSQTEPHG